MLPASLAFAWVLWRQHRWGLAVVLSYLVVAGLASAVLPAHFSGSQAGSVFTNVALPLFFLPVYVLVVFTYGLEIGELNTRESCFPPRLLRLPLPTAAVAWWMLLYGAAIVILLWLAIAGLILRPWLARWNESAPLWWPALFSAAALACVQALVWSPFGLPWVRVILLLAQIPMFIVLGMIAAKADVSEAILVSGFASVMVIAWTGAYLGVRRARCGDVPNWDWMLTPVRRLALWLPAPRGHFTSADRAQVWFEWWRVGKTFPIVVGVALPMFLWPLLLKFDLEVTRVGAVLIATHWILIAPGFLAGITLFERRAGMMPFIAALPMRTADMIGAILKAATASTLAAWAIVAAVLPGTILMTGNADVLMEWRQQPASKPINLVPPIMAAALLAFVWTWKRKVDRLFAKLMGRRWIEIILGCVCIPGYFAALGIYFGCADSLMLPPEIVMGVLPWLIGLVFLGRLLAAGWALQQTIEWGLLTLRTAACWAAGWLLIASSLFAALAWTIPPEERIAPHYLAYLVLFAMPMARLAAMPLALAWNRYR